MTKAEAIPKRDALDDFVDAFAAAVASGAWRSLVLSKQRDPSSDLKRVTLRPAAIRGEARVAIVHRHTTRDLTRHVARADATGAARDELRAGFDHATLKLDDAELQLLTSRKGRRTLVRSRGSPPPPSASEGATPAHDRARHRIVPIESRFLVELGVTDAQHRVVPAMARKWRQIDKFVEVFDQAWRSSALVGAHAMTVVDFGCGKGALTFAVHDHLRRHGVDATVVGFELRAELVDEANRIAARIGAQGLSFVAGDLRSHAVPAMDVTIALHACDTATDHALDLGIQAAAAILVVSPCCHKELRPQLTAHAAGAPLAPLRRHGVHLGQQAEMLTDSLRVLALESTGYDAKVFEFVSPEHTGKNKMILATRRAAASVAEARARDEIEVVKTYWGIREQCLERLLRERANGGGNLAGMASAVSRTG